MPHMVDSSIFERIAAIYNAANGLDNPDHMYLDCDYFRQIYSVPGIDIARDIVLVRKRTGRGIRSDCQGYREN